VRELTHRVLVGGTASGKKTVAAALCRRHGLVPLSMDSMKVYRGMDIGTDKPPRALVEELDWQLLDLVGHHERYSAGRWVEEAARTVAGVEAPVLFAGGTPLYLRLLLRGMIPVPPADAALGAELDQLWEREGEASFREQLAAVDPELEQRLLPGDKKRLVRGLEVHRLTGRPLSDWQREETVRPIDGSFTVVALRHEAGAHERRLRERVGRMFDDGLLEEVRALQAEAPFGSEAGRCIGYAEAQDVLAGRLTQDAARERVAVRTRQLVRKQRMFLASFPDIHWVDIAEHEPAEELVARVESAFGLA
jgi:tRNA dimethylallyltransferase